MVLNLARFLYNNVRFYHKSRKAPDFSWYNQANQTQVLQWKANAEATAPQCGNTFGPPLRGFGQRTGRRVGVRFIAPFQS